MTIDFDWVSTIAERNGWKLIAFQRDIWMASYRRHDQRINVYLTKGTIGTCLHHPEKGRTQLFRKGLSLEQVEKLFSNPREHTGKGYRFRRDKKNLRAA